jgi:hypothetical protein
MDQSMRFRRLMFGSIQDLSVPDVFNGFPRMMVFARSVSAMNTSFRDLAQYPAGLAYKDT